MPADGHTTSPTSFAHDEDFFSVASAICDPYLAQVGNAEAVRLAHHRREADRSRGVCVSGMGPDPITPRTEAELVADADAARARRQTFLASPRGRFLKASFELGSVGYAEAETARAIYSRSFADDREPVDAAAVGRCIRLLAPIDHSLARLAVAALADLLAPAVSA